jgi:regulator of sigma E protease
MTTAIAFIILIGVIVFIHEFGHFAAAKLSGVKVDIFSLGFGPKLIGARWGETEYMVSAIPFGGYVKMVGEVPEEGEEDAETEVDERSFLGKSKRVRALIVAAGPAMNFLLAIVIFGALIYQGGLAVPSTTEIGVVKAGTPAWAAGVRAGDIVTRVGGDSVGNWQDLEHAFKDNLGSRTEVAVERGGRSKMFTVDLTHVRKVDGIGVDLYIPPVADSVVAGSPAYKAGIRRGDRIVEIDGRPIFTWQDIAQIAEPAPGKALEIKWVRGGKAHDSTIIPEDVMGVGKLGIVDDFEDQYVLVPAGLFLSAELGIKRAAQMSIQIIYIPRLLRAGYSIKEVVGGPVRIGQLAGQTLKMGIGTFVAFIGMVSAQLCLINLLPIPVLDGGHLLVLGLEAVARRPISTRRRMIAQQIGLAALIAFMVFVTLVDVSRLLGG